MHDFLNSSYISSGSLAQCVIVVIFLKNNFEKISRILNRRSALHKSIDSLQIELVALENMLKIRAKETGLSNFQMIGEPISKGIDQVSLRFNANGTYREMVLWLKNIESDVPYLVVNRVDMQTDADAQERAFSLNIYFRYKLAAGDEEAA